MKYNCIESVKADLQEQSDMLQQLESRKSQLIQFDGCTLKIKIQAPALITIAGKILLTPGSILETKTTRTFVPSKNYAIATKPFLCSKTTLHWRKTC